VALEVPFLLHPEEPPAGPWRVEDIATLSEAFASRPAAGARRPMIIAIDGRSSSGKTTLAARWAELVLGAAVVHTDDLAWHHSMFGWADLALAVLEPVHRGEPVRFRPPAWKERGRAGEIVVERAVSLLLVEGVGASRRELAHVLDASFWVQADRDVTGRRNEARIAAGEVAASVVRAWMAEEHEFVAGRRPWRHADLVVAGTPEVHHDPVTQVVVADGPLVD
jgi:uridine kinase